jgi:hypothetical protein
MFKMLTAFYVMTSRLRDLERKVKMHIAAALFIAQNAIRTPR